MTRNGHSLQPRANHDIGTVLQNCENNCFWTGFEPQENLQFSAGHMAFACPRYSLVLVQTSNIAMRGEGYHRIADHVRYVASLALGKDYMWLYKRK